MNGFYSFDSSTIDKSFYLPPTKRKLQAKVKQTKNRMKVNRQKRKKKTNSSNWNKWILMKFSFVVQNQKQNNNNKIHFAIHCESKTFSFQGFSLNFSICFFFACFWVARARTRVWIAGTNTQDRNDIFCN